MSGGIARRPATLAVAISLTCLAVAPVAVWQQPRFKSGVEAVQVDVSVLDRDRRPVRGLTAADFTVVEDGKPQAITTFSAIDVPEVEESPAPWVRDVPPDVENNVGAAAERRVMVLVMDDGVPMPAIDVLHARELARQTIDRLGPDDLAAVVYTMGQKNGQEFTHDRARLRASVEKYSGGIDNMVGMDVNGNAYVVPFDQFNVAAAALYRATVATLRGVTDALSGMPTGRKALVYIGVGIPVDVSVAGPLEKASTGADGSVTPHSRDDAGGVAQQMILDLLESFRAAQRANVNIYTIDPGGLRAPGVLRDPFAGSSTLNGSPGTLNQDFLHAVSANTGGFAIVNTNAPAQGIAQMFRENGSYYLLGYEPANPRATGRYRRIEVRVNRPDVTVRARGGYYEPRPGKPSKTAAQTSAIERAISAFVPKADIAMQVAASPFAIPGTRDGAVAVALGIRVPAPQGSERVVENLDVLVRAYGEDGKAAASERLQVRLVLRPGTGTEAQCEVLSRLDLKPGRYQLRVGADNAARARSGSVHLDLDVPDFSKAALALSGLVLSATSGPTTVGKDKLASLVPVVPTSARVFSTSDAAAAFVRVYQGGKRPIATVRVTARVVDARGATSFESMATLGPERFSSNRAADYQLELPVSRLSGGQYLLTLEATQQQTGTAERASSGEPSARRDVRFSIR